MSDNGKLKCYGEFHHNSIYLTEFIGDRKHRTVYTGPTRDVDKVTHVTVYYYALLPAESNNVKICLNLPCNIRQLNKALLSLLCLKCPVIQLASSVELRLCLMCLDVKYLFQNFLD